MIYICIGHATIYCHSRYSMTANMKTPQTRFITLAAIKVTNTEHTAINGNHSKCRMTPFSCALCAFARVLSRRCLWRDIFLAKPQRAQGLSAIPNNYGVQFDVPKMELFLIYSDYLFVENTLTSMRLQRDNYRHKLQN